MKNLQEPPEVRREEFLEKPLPSSEESERVILGAIILDNRLLIEAMAMLTENDFYSPLHRKVFSAMISLHKRNKAVAPDAAAAGGGLSPVFLGEELRKTGSLESIGGISTIISLTYGLPHFSNIFDYCKVVKDKAEVRALIKLANELQKDCLDEESDAPALKARFASRLLLVGDDKLTKPKSSREVWERVKVRFNSWIEDDKPVAVGTGIPELNAALRYGGYAKQDLIFTAARPSIGKTALMLTHAAQAAMLGIPPLVFTLEMSDEDLFMRMLPARSGVKNMSITPTTVRKNLEARARLKKAGDELAALPFFLESDCFALDKLIAKAELSVRRDGVKIVFLDYLQMLKATTGSGEAFGQRRRRDQELEQISRELKQMARRLDIPVVCLAQLNRAVEFDDRRPEISDIREAGASEQDADVIILPYRTDSRRKKKGEKTPACPLVTPDPSDEDDNPSVVSVSLFIGKQRNGRANLEVLTDFDMDYQRFMTTSLWASDRLDKLD